MCVWVQYFSWSPYSHPVMTAQFICSLQYVAGYNILAGHLTADQSWQLSAHLLTAICGWIQYFSLSPYSHPVMAAQLSAHSNLWLGQYFSWTPYSHPVVTAQLICSQQYVSGYNILAGHHIAIQSWQLSSTTHSQQCLAGFNILAVHHTAIQSWQLSYLLISIWGWVQYFSWSPYSHPVMTPQLISSQQCVSGYNILAGHHTAIQSWQLSSSAHSYVWLSTIFLLVTLQPSSHDTPAHLLIAMCSWIQYFSWSLYSHPVMTAQLICSQMHGWVQYLSWSLYSHPVMTAHLSAHRNVWLGTIF